MAAITAQAVREAAELLGIQERASLSEIRIRYHERLREWHPDVSKNGPAASHEMTIRLMAAYELLTEYCMNYSFSFRLEDLVQSLDQSPADYWTDRFGDDPIWG